jgi:hypothetical protein
VYALSGAPIYVAQDATPQELTEIELRVQSEMDQLNREAQRLATSSRAIENLASSSGAETFAADFANPHVS